MLMFRSGQATVQTSLQLQLDRAGAALHKRKRKISVARCTKLIQTYCIHTEESLRKAQDTFKALKTTDITTDYILQDR